MSNTNTFKRVKKAFTYNIMVVGASGLGKTTFIKTLFDDSKFIPEEEKGPHDLTALKTTEIRVFSTEIDLDKKRINLSIIDTPGFGDLLDNSKSTEIVANSVEEQFRVFLKEESRIQRNAKFLDPRVHLILYFIAPNGHGLTELDASFMRRLGTRTNVIPVIAKADSLGIEELANFKKTIMHDIRERQIEIFDFPYASDLDDEIAKENDYLESLLPFAIVGSEKKYTVGDRSVRGRMYPWGVVEVDNKEHCDFVPLKAAIFSSHLDDLKDLTHDVHYEAFRKADLLSRGKRDSSIDPDMEYLNLEEQHEENSIAAALIKKRSRRDLQRVAS